MDTISLYARDREKRAVGQALRLALVASVAVAAVLLSLLASASANSALFERNYPLLLWGNAAIALALALLTAELIRRIARRARRRVFGSRLMIRLALTFTAMTVLPGLLIYFVAVQFLGRSIESWFDVPVDRALESGVNLGRSAFDSLQAELLSKARRIGNELAEQPLPQWQRELDRWRDQLGVEDAAVLSGSGRLLLSSGARYAQLAPDLPTTQVLQQVRLVRQYAAIEGLELLGETPEGEGLVPLHTAPALPGAAPARLQVRVVRVIPSAVPGGEARLLQLLQPVPAALAANADAVSLGQREYQQLSLSRQGLKRIFHVTLTLTLLLTVFSSVAGAFLLSGWLTGPLTMLAAGTRAVAEGDYRPVKDYGSRDELGVLTQSFNVMTRQLGEARAQVVDHQRDLEQAKARLERVLTSLSAAVLAFDAQFRLSLVNQATARVLGVELTPYVGQPLSALPVLGAFANTIRTAFEETAASGIDRWQRQFRLGAPGDEGGEASAWSDASSLREATEGNPEAGLRGRTLLANGTSLPGPASIGPLPERSHEAPPSGFLIVFDDVSAVVSAQRTLAWNEVARRLAHEIKNPLTPIQLTAERLPRKLAAKLNAVDADFLRRGASTIVNQVEALARMVDDFRNYARLPAAQLAALDLNELVREVLLLYGGQETEGASEGETAVAGVQAKLLPIPRVLADASQLRQVLHNLVKNAQEAIAAGPRASAGRVEISTAPLLRESDGGVAGVRLRVRDEGPGFSAGVLARAFEPYVTAKARGTGLGLAIVRKIIDEHGARIQVENRVDEQGTVLGAQVEVVFSRLAS